MSAAVAGPRVLLRPVTPADGPLLQRAEARSDLAPRWRSRGAAPGGPRRAGDDTLTELLIVAPGSETPIGIVALYGHDDRVGHAWLAAASLDPGRRSVLMMLGLAVFVHQVFERWELRRVLMELPEFNLPQFASGLGRLFFLEARLRDHCYHGGAWWDQLILAIDRETLAARDGPLLRVALGVAGAP